LRESTEMGKRTFTASIVAVIALAAVLFVAVGDAGILVVISLAGSVAGVEVGWQLRALQYWCSGTISTSGSWWT
jgi:hypothetical protein